eukprot:CAMPEP_0194142904 /NCGR_PEP_ID=MMETSP0152-20130528/12115_1 /TAXON_ID=1049557 /ORGANISM="Thalassiothrix antarctica, Strain L6-D1" /LENGTH=195 /DNA_ID=CAMNT_0038842059 /DNA_START=376 /DNA_END=964 /DNA_ORIENTATION=+
MSGEDESGEDDSNEDDSGEDESGEDESGKDESGEDDSGEDDSGEDESGDDESGDDDAGDDDAGDDDDLPYNDYLIGKELDLISEDTNDYQEMKHNFSYDSVESQEKEEESDPTTMDMEAINKKNSLKKNSNKEYDDDYDLPQLGENTDDIFFTATTDTVAGDNEDDDDYDDTSLFDDDDGLMDEILHRNKSNNSN